MKKQIETSVAILKLTFENLIARLLSYLPVLTTGNEYEEIKEVGKGNRRMPWLSKAKKDVISCDKRGGGANDP